MNKVYKALSDPTRRRILELLREQDLSAGQIAAHFTITRPSLSRHFNILREANLIHGDRSGTTIIYHLNISILEEALMSLLNRFQIN